MRRITLCQVTQNKEDQSCFPLVKSATHALLITGTPALNRPIELFSQLFVTSGVHKELHAYAARYCNGKPTPLGYDDRGSSNAWELHWVLKKGFMVRRLKRDVLTQLPPKTRRTVWLEVKTDQLKDKLAGFREWKKLNRPFINYQVARSSSGCKYLNAKVISELMRPQRQQSVNPLFSGLCQYR